MGHVQVANILKQLFFSISVNSGRIFTEPRSGEVNILPLFTEIEKNNCLILHQAHVSFYISGSTAIVALKTETYFVCSQGIVHFDILQKPEKIRASTGFEPVTSAIPVRCALPTEL